MIRQSQRFLSQIYALTDFLIIQLCFVCSWWLKFQSSWFSNEPGLSFSTYFVWCLAYGFIAVITGFYMGFYTPKRKKRFSYELYRILQIHSISLLTLLSILFIMKEVHVSRSFLLLFLGCNVVLISIYRFVLKKTLRKLRENGYNKQFILIIGAGSVGRQFYKTVRLHPDLGYEVVGFLDDSCEEINRYNPAPKPVLGIIDDLSEVLNTQLVDEVVIALPLDAHHKYARIIAACEKAGVKTLIIPDFFDLLPARPHFDNFAGIPLINVRDVPLDELKNRFLKRLFDIVFASMAIIITSPVMLLVIIGIKISSPGPIIFKQERVGFNRRTFNMYKFRSMKVMPSEQSNTEWTVENDPRTFAFGRFIRRTSLDEFPQFFNVLKGDMSVVGPRPERPYFVEQFKEDIPKYMIKHHIRPGMTGWAQSNGLRGDTSISDRIKYDLFYIENWTLLLDIKIIWKTITNGFVNKNAY